MIPAREDVAVALYNLVDAGARKVAPIATSSRRLVPYDRLDAAQMPALFLTQVPEKDAQGYGGMIGMPPTRTMYFEIWLYVCEPQESSIVPATQLNTLTDAVQQALIPLGAYDRQTLGNLVQSARLERDVEVYEDVTADGISIAIMTVAVLLP